MVCFHRLVPHSALTSAAESTISMMFQASRSHDRVSLPMSPERLPQPLHRAQHGTQTSLHSFWALPHSKPGVIPPPDLQCSPTTVACEDCDSAIWQRTDDGIYSEFGEVGFQCGPCQRTVCSGCSVLYVDEMRVCLACEHQRRLES